MKQEIAKSNLEVSAAQRRTRAGRGTGGVSEATWHWSPLTAER